MLRAVSLALPGSVLRVRLGPSKKERETQEGVVPGLLANTLAFKDQKSLVDLVVLLSKILGFHKGCLVKTC